MKLTAITAIVEIKNRQIMKNANSIFLVDKLKTIIK
jgi:hypothetical protein